MIDLRKTIISHVLVGLLSVPVQLFAAPPSAPPAMEVENVEKLDKFEKSEKVEPAKSRELEPSDSGEMPQSLVNEKPSRLVTGLAQTTIGMLGGFLFAFAGGLLGLAVCQSDRCALGSLALGYGVGMPITVWAYGESKGWDGSLLATFAGFAVSVAVLSAVLEGVSNGDAQEAILLASLLGMPAGSAIAYHVSAEWPKSSGAVAVPNVTSIPIMYFEF